MVFHIEQKPVPPSPWVMVPVQPFGLIAFSASRERVYFS
jgi:hypothetical protein